MIYEMNNPSNEERHKILREALRVINREEDFEHIIEFMSPPEPITSILPIGSLKDKKVGVIGAGCAGLTSAYELRKLGCDITILEGNISRIGGRVYTYSFGNGFYGELGAMRIPVSHETTWHFINELNLPTNPFFQNSENNITYANNTRLVGLNIDKAASEFLYPKYNLNEWERNAHLSQLFDLIYFEPIRSLPVNIRPYLIAIREHYPKPIDLYGEIDFRKNCERLGFSEDGINMINSIIGTDRGFFYYNFLEILKEYYPVSFIYLYEITGGLYKLPYALADSFKDQKDGYGHVTIKMGARVTGIYDQFNQVKLQYLDEFTHTFKEKQFDYVICAIPFSTLRLIDINPRFHNRKMEAIREANYSPAQKSLIYFKEAFFNDKIKGGRIWTDLPLTSVWFPSHYFPNKGTVVTAYSTNLDATRITNLPTDLQIYENIKELEEIYGYPKNYLLDKVVGFKSINYNNYDLTLGAYEKYYTRQNELFSYASILPEYHNKIFFAGEHASPIHGWIQGALSSGMNASNQLALAVKSNLFIK